MTSVTTERQNAITQFMDALEIERQAIIEDFMTSVTAERRDTVAQMETILTSERQAAVDDFMAREQLIVESALQQINQTAESQVDKALDRITVLMTLFLAGLTLANLLVGYMVHRKSLNRQTAAS